MKKKILFFLAINILLTAISFAKEFDKNFKIAKEYSYEKLFDDAAKIYLEIYNKSNNENIKEKALFLAAKTFDEKKDFKSAIKYYLQIFNTNKKNPLADISLFNAAICFYKEHEYEKSYYCFKEHSLLYPNSFHIKSSTLFALKLQEKIAYNKMTLKMDVKDINLKLLVQENIKKIKIDSKSLISIFDNDNNKIFMGMPPVFIESSNFKVLINNKEYPLTKYRIKTNDKDYLVNGTHFMGDLSIIPNLLNLSLVNTLKMEDYLKIIVPFEMPSCWNDEAIKAQAVASRTFALYMKIKNNRQFYDIIEKNIFQIYDNFILKSSNQEKINNAIKETNNQIITYNDNIILSCFHSNSGGYTESSENVWGRNLPYLKSFKDIYSSNSQYSNWEKFFPYDFLIKKLQEKKIINGQIESFAFEDFTKSGRVLKIILKSKKVQKQIKSNDFRLILGSKELRSTLFEIKAMENGILFQGKGFGHGVGMSQWGANKMAQNGYNYENIIQYYYPGTKLFSLNLAQKNNNLNSLNHDLLCLILEVDKIF